MYIFYTNICWSKQNGIIHYKYFALDKITKLLIKCSKNCLLNVCDIEIHLKLKFLSHTAPLLLSIIWNNICSKIAQHKAHKDNF